MSTSTATAPFQYLQPTWRVDQVQPMIQAMHDDGFVLVPNALTPAEVAETRARIDRVQPTGFDTTEGKTHHYKNVFNKDPYFLHLIDRPGLIDVVEGVLGDQCHIIGQSAWRSYPGHDGGGLHVDQLWFPMPEDVLLRPDVKLPILYATMHFYLSDIPLELCPTYVIPGSHKSGRGPKQGETTWNGRAASPVLCKAGDALFFRSEVWHSGSRNASDQIRYLLQVHYSVRNGAQHFSPFMSWQFNPATLAAATPRQRRLLGDHPRMAYD